MLSESDKSTVSEDTEGQDSDRKHNHRISRNGTFKRHDKVESESYFCRGGGSNNFTNFPNGRDGVAKNNSRKRGINFQDMYDNDDLFDDDDDEDDSDWDPLQQFVPMEKWFCTNCTVANIGDCMLCNICGEHRNSGILKQGCLSSPFVQYSDLDGSILDVKSKSKEKIRFKASGNSCVTAVGFDERMLLHSEIEMKSHPHPERPDRLRAIAASLASSGIFPGKCFPIPAREITKDELLMVHSMEHVQTVDLTSQIFSSYFTPDTYANEHSAQAARLAAGLCADLAVAIFSGRVKNGFALVRPPGHHAGVKHAMGFCLHNNAAVAALAAQKAGAKKVLIVDWDVHHGNGTQEIFDKNKSVLYVSLHRHEGGTFYPGTGAAIEVGTAGAEGYCVNIPWSRRGVGDNDYMFAFQHVVIPIATEFSPDLTIISAGFDAARGDPLGCCDVTPSGYAWMTKLLYNITNGKLLVILEGGYNLRSISSSATAVIKILLGENPATESNGQEPSRSGLKSVVDVLNIQKNYWPKLHSTIQILESQFPSHSNNKKRKEFKKGHANNVPIWWKWGRNRLLFQVLRRRLNLK